MEPGSLSPSLAVEIPPASPVRAGSQRWSTRVVSVSRSHRLSRADISDAEAAQLEQLQKRRMAVVAKIEASDRARADLHRELALALEELGVPPENRARQLVANLPQAWHGAEAVRPVDRESGGKLLHAFHEEQLEWYTRATTCALEMHHLVATLELPLGAENDSNEVCDGGGSRKAVLAVWRLASQTWYNKSGGSETAPHALDSSALTRLSLLRDAIAGGQRRARASLLDGRHSLAHLLRPCAAATRLQCGLSRRCRQLAGLHCHLWRLEPG